MAAVVSTTPDIPPRTGSSPCCNKDPGDPFKDHGMLANDQRKCRDVLCLIVFVLFCVGMLVVGAIGLKYGEPMRLIYGSDYKGRVCGVDIPSKPLTAYPRVTEDFLANVGKTNPLDYKFYGICVDKCPTAATFETMDVICNDDGDAAPLPGGVTRKLACFNSSDPGCAAITNNCWVTPQNTTSTLFRCIPVYEASNNGSAKCVYPPAVSDANDIRCLLSETTSETHVVRSAKPNQLFDSLNTGRQQWGRWFGDLFRAWWVILVCAVGVALAMGFLFAFFMKYCTVCIVWTTIVFVILGFCALDIYFYFKGGILTWDMVGGENTRTQLQGALSKVDIPSVHITGVSQAASVMKGYASTTIASVLTALNLTSQDAYRIIAYIFSAICLIMLILVVALHSSIKTAISVIKLGADALGKMPLLVLYPPLASLGLAAFLMWWIFVAASLATAGTIETSSLAGDVQGGLNFLNATFAAAQVPLGAFGTSSTLSLPTLNATIVTLKQSNVTPYLLIYHFFGLLWITQFYSGVVCLTLAGAVAGWYFSLNEQDDPEVAKRLYARGKHPILAALGRTLYFYLGTVAFGSLLIAFIQFIRSVLAYLKRQLQRSTSNPSARFVVACVECCLCVVQACVELITRNAFIYVAVKGISFCAAGRRVFQLITTNAATLMFVNVLCEVIMLIAKVGIAAVCAWVAFIILENAPMFQPGGKSQISSSWIVILVTFFFGFAVASSFMSIYDMTVDTILVCYVTDMEENALRGGAKVAGHVAKDKMAYNKLAKEAPPLVDAGMHTNPMPGRGGGTT